MSSNDKLLVTLDRGVKRITFNRPERRNAIDFEMFERFAAAVKETKTDGTRVLVITGAGEAFSSGLDLASLNPSDLAKMDVATAVREMINPPVLALRELPVPVVARVHGPAAGIGFSYVLASDIRVASDEAQFSQSFVRVGLMPDGGSTHFLPRLVGYARAFELMATGAQLDARQAHALGIINHVVPRAELDALVDDIAARLASAPQPSLARIKDALGHHEATALATALNIEANGQAACFRSADFIEGVTAFMQKRPPVFGKK